MNDSDQNTDQNKDCVQKFFPKRKLPNGNRLRMQSALIFLGFAENKIKKQKHGLNNFKLKLNKLKPKSFWLRDDLDYLFKDAFEIYKRRRKELHPDKNLDTDTNQEMAELNSVWDFIKKTFERKGFTLD